MYINTDQRLPKILSALLTSYIISIPFLSIKRFYCLLFQVLRNKCNIKNKNILFKESQDDYVNVIMSFVFTDCNSEAAAIGKVCKILCKFDTPPESLSMQIVGIYHSLTTLQVIRNNWGLDAVSIGSNSVIINEMWS